MPCTSAATERSFSSQSIIHTKKRNRLTAERAVKLNYVRYNMTLLNYTAKAKNEDSGNKTNNQAEDSSTSSSNTRVINRLKQNLSNNVQQEMVTECDAAGKELGENWKEGEEEEGSSSDDDLSWNSKITGNGNSEDDINILSGTDSCSEAEEYTDRVSDENENQIEKQIVKNEDFGNQTDRNKSQIIILQNIGLNMESDMDAGYETNKFIDNTGTTCTTENKSTELQSDILGIEGDINGCTGRVIACQKFYRKRKLQKKENFEGGKRRL